MNQQIIRHFFDRTGGVSKGLYESLNCALGSDDSPELVRQNKAIVAGQLGLPESSLATLKQTHSADAVFVDADFLEKNRPEADAMVTTSPNIILGILTADCVPVLLQDESACVIGAAHAGWKGAHGGVVQNTVGLMQKHGANLANIRAFIGPAINQTSYEVGADFYERLMQESAANAQFFVPAARMNHHQFDLKNYVASKLRSAGVTHIDIHSDDTCAMPKKYFSYRRSCLQDKADYGRQISVILMKEQ